MAEDKRVDREATAAQLGCFTLTNTAATSAATLNAATAHLGAVPVLGGLAPLPVLPPTTIGAPPSEAGGRGMGGGVAAAAGAPVGRGRGRGKTLPAWMTEK